MSIGRAGMQPVLLLLLTSGFWGAATVLNKVLLLSLAVCLSAFYPTLASSIALWAFSVLLRKPFPARNRLLPIVLFGFLNLGISYTFSMVGLQRIDAGISSLLWALEPFLILVLAHAVLKERVTVGAALTIATGFMGALLVSQVIFQTGETTTDWLGIVWLMTAVAICAIYTVAMRRVGEGIDTLTLTAVQQSAGLAWVALLQLLMSGSEFVMPLAAMEPSAVLSGAMTGLMYYAAAYWLYLTALKRVSAGLAGASFNLIPLVTIWGAFLFLGERLSLMQILGAGLIVLSGIALGWFASPAVPLLARRYEP